MHKEQHCDQRAEGQSLLVYGGNTRKKSEEDGAHGLQKLDKERVDPLLQLGDIVHDLLGEEDQVGPPLFERQLEGYPVSQHQLCLPSRTALF